MQLSSLKIDDDFKNLLPELDAETYTALEKDIVSNGLISPIVTWNGFIADGHNRYSILKAHHIEEVQTKELKKSSKSEVMQWICNSQMARRNLLKSQIVIALSKVEEQIAKEKGDKSLANLKQNRHTDTSNLTVRKKEPDGETTEIMARKAGFRSKNTWKDAKLIVAEGTPDKIRRMDEGGKRNGISTIAKEIRAGAKDNERICPKCGKIKPLDEFTSSSSSHYSWCRECENARKREAYYKGEVFKDIGKAINSLKGEEKKDITGQTEELKFLISNFISSVNRIINDYGTLNEDSIKELEILVDYIKKLKGESTDVWS